MYKRSWIFSVFWNFIGSECVSGFIFGFDDINWLLVESQGNFLDGEESGGKGRIWQKIGYLAQVSDDLKSAKDIRLYSMAGWLGDIYQKNIKELGGWYKRYTKRVFGVAAGESGLSLLREIAAYAYLIYMVMDGTLGVADFVLYFGVITGFSTWLSALFGQVNVLQRISIAVDYFRTFLGYLDVFLRDGGFWSEELMVNPKEISFCNVCYRYEGVEQDTLSGLNLTLRQRSIWR